MTPSERADFRRQNLSHALAGKKILLGITGSIAAFKACDIARLLRDSGATVRVALTDSAQKFVTKVTLETLTGQPVYTSLWDDGARGTHHIDAARWADLALIAPASANTIAKLAHGMADDLLTTELLAFRGTVERCLLLAPAMNPAMYSNPAVQANLETLKSRGWTILGPVSGLTACGEEGLGRMLEPEEIVERAARSFDAPINGKHVLITLGPTRSPVDPVRFLSNRSSGLMGAALCWAALARGYRVTAVCGPTDAELPRDIERIDVTTAAEMAAATLQVWPYADLFISAAAVLDWDIMNPATRKLKKGQHTPKLELTANLDILAAVSKQKRPDQFTLGFAAETDQPLENAMAKLRAKGCDAIFANDVSRGDQGFESLSNSGWWISLHNTMELKHGPKTELARSLLALIDSDARELETHVTLN